MKKWIVVFIILLSTTALHAQERIYHFTSDFLFRYERQQFPDIFPGRDDVDRFRVRWRPGVVIKPNLIWTIGLEVEANGIHESDGDVDPPRFPEFHSPIFDRDNFKRNSVVLSKAFAKYSPTSDLEFIGGKFDNPFITTEMVWDNDLRPNGGVLKVSAGADDEAWRITGRIGDFYASHYLHDRTNVVAAQGAFILTEGVTKLTFAASYYDHNVHDLDPSLVRTNTRSGFGLLNDYNLFDLIGRVRFGFEFVPIMAQFDYVHNTAANSFDPSMPGNGDTGWLVEATVGQFEEVGDFELGWAYHHVESDAVLAAYNTDDWWFPTRGEGYRIHGGLMVAPHVIISASYLNQSFIDQSPEFKRWQVNCIVKWP